MSPARPSTAEPLRIAVDVTNAGSRAGDEVVQLYVRDVVGSVTRPVKQLAGFARVHLRPAADGAVSASTLDPSQLAFYDAAMRFVVEPGAFRIMVGASADDVRAETTVTLEGGIRELSTADLIPTAVEVD